MITISARHDFHHTTIRLKVSPSTLDRTVTTLRGHLNIELFREAAQDISLARTKRRFLTQIRPTLQSVSTTVRTMDRFHSAPTKALQLGASRNTTRVILAPIILRCLEHCPSVQMSVIASEDLISVITNKFSTKVQLTRDIPRSVVTVTVAPPLHFTIITSPRCFTGFGGPGIPTSLLTRGYVHIHFPDNSVCG